MKEKIFTLIIALVVGIGISANAQLNMGTGVPWGSLGAGEPLVLNEDFSGFTFYHSDSTTDMGNSNNYYDTDGTTVIYGYKNDTTETPILGSTSGKIKYYFDQCAFAPEWKTAWAFKDGGGQTANVSNGFVEISRDYGASGEYLPTVRGSFVVDLRELEFVEVIQWTHSSCGGNKRGVMLEFSLDDGNSWDTLRYQPAGGLWGYSFTKDVMTLEKTSNGYNCQPSAYGMTWEDGIYAENVMLRFGEAGGQVPRIHDLKVYGTYTPPTSVNVVDKEELKIYSFNKKIRISEPADVRVYSIMGNLIKHAVNTNSIQMNDVPNGIYLVKAKNLNSEAVSKVLIR
ncbi:T9SS type A sorting domain-containing protein [Maribellus sediminis]|uniref:T9SS type A sorting domain-containing protein n=1 Tax=Maribellus sediminis TaxID=2696285 RepID=UPI00142F8FBF|nr:T9SS type A sorting domain-containing protein [Maribellus sediminis]